MIKFNKNWNCKWGLCHWDPCKWGALSLKLGFPTKPSLYIVHIGHWSSSSDVLLHMTEHQNPAQCEIIVLTACTWRIPRRVWSKLHKLSTSFSLHPTSSGKLQRKSTWNMWHTVMIQLSSSRLVEGFDATVISKIVINCLFLGYYSHDHQFQNQQVHSVFLPRKRAANSNSWPLS